MGSFLGRSSNCSIEWERWREVPSANPAGRPIERDKEKAGLMNLVLDPSKTGREAENLEFSLRRMIVGQDEAIQQIVNIYQMNLTSMNPPGRPLGNFLFLGPTGSGKTRIV